MKHLCGLFTSKEEPVSLKSIAVTLSIHDFVADVSAILNYENEEKNPLETFFVFPMEEDCAVYCFEALVDGKTIVAELMEKEKARNNYENALIQGRQVYLLEEDSAHDVFSCNVGNLDPGCKVSLTLKYVLELTLESDGALRFVLPAILNPRHQPFSGDVETCMDLTPLTVSLKELTYTLSMVATISSQQGIEKIQSNCSLSAIKYLEDDKTSAQVSLAEGHKFDRDVELLIYYSAVHKPSVTVEMGMPGKMPGSLMGDSCAMVSFYPDIPEQDSRFGGEFIFLMDCSGSMESPMSSEDTSPMRIDVAKETLVLMLKSLPEDCYFNVYEFGSYHQSFFPKSVKYTQETMKEAMKKVELMCAELGGTEILAPLQEIFKGSPIPGYPLQLFVFTDGEVCNTFSVIKEVNLNRNKHRCFSFGIGQGASTSLIKSIARATGGTAEFITGKDRMQSKALRSLKYSLQSVVENFSVNWDLPSGLSVNVLSKEHPIMFKGQRLIIYAQLTGKMPTDEAGKVYLKYNFNGKSFVEEVAFSLQPKANDNFPIHRLAAKTLIQTKDLGTTETPANDKKEVLSVSVESGVMSSFTAFIAINKDLNKTLKAPLAQRFIPSPMLLGTGSGQSQSFSCATRIAQGFESSPFSTRPSAMPCCAIMSYAREPPHPRGTQKKSKKKNKGFSINDVVQLICLQNANGSWDMDEGLANALGISLEDIKSAHPTEVVEPSEWATMLAVLWLHSRAMDNKNEWDLLERKAVAWLRKHADDTLSMLIKTGNAFLKSSVNPAIFTI